MYQKNKLIDLEINSVLLIDKLKEKLFTFGTRIFVSGAVTDSFFEFLKNQHQISEIEIIVRDFTKIFVSPEVYYSFLKKGGKIKVVQKTKLIAVCVNPISPDGYNLNSDELIKALDYLSGNKIGAIITFEKTIQLKEDLTQMKLIFLTFLIMISK